MKKYGFTAYLTSAVLAAIAAGCSSPRSEAVSDYAAGITDNLVWAITDVSVLDHKEVADLAGETGTQTLMGTPLHVEAVLDDWLKVETPEGYHSWVKELAVARMDSAAFDDWRKAPKLMVTSPYVTLRDGPSESARQVRDAVLGCILGYDGEDDCSRWYSASLPDGTSVYLPKDDAMDFDSWLDRREPTGENIAATATSLLGIPYVWGGTSVKGMDCSGFTKTVYFLNGLILRRNASQQQNDGIRIETDSLATGDLIFFGRRATDDIPAKASHVGIFLDSARFIHASAYVRISSLDSDDPDWYPNAVNLIGAVRMTGSEGPIPGAVPIKDHPWYCSH